MKLTYTTLIFFLLVIPFSKAQEKKKVDYTIYDEWKSFRTINQSESGNWITYEVNPSVGDGTLTIENINSGQKKAILKGGNGQIAFSEDFTIFSLDPGYDTIRQLKLDEVSKKEWPIDTLGVYYHNGDSIKYIPGVNSFQLAEESNWVGYMLDEDKTPDCPAPKKGLFSKRRNKKNKCEKQKTSGKTLVVWNPISNESKEIHGVVSFDFDKSGNRLVFVKSEKDDEDSLSVNLVDLSNWNTKRIDDKKLSIKYVSFNEEGNQLVYLATADTNKLKNYELYTWTLGSESGTSIVDSLTANMPTDWTVSGNKRPFFSQDGSRIFFGTNKIIRQEVEDTLLKSEKAKVDVWRWNDPYIQPGQLLNKFFTDKQTFLAVYDLQSNAMVQIADSLVEDISIKQKGNSEIAIGSSDLGYEMERTWTYPWRSDYYKVNLLTGERELIKKGLIGGGSLSPQGDKFVWFSTVDSAWMSKDLTSGKEVNLTKNIDALFSEDNNGVPYAPQDAGTEGWLKVGDIEYYVVKDRFDIWALDPMNPEGQICLTGGTGKSDKIQFNLIQFEMDSAYIQMDKVILYGTNDITKNGSYWSIAMEGKSASISKLLESNHRLVHITKAKQSDKLLIRRMNFQTYGELESTNMSFESPKMLTDINPQQSEYNWGTVEFTEWEAYNGEEMRGLLYKPEDFDSTKSYPLMVYFYETYTENFHAYYPPRATASIIYPTEYISNGYIVFIPDVHYKEGHPAQGAFDCIVSGSETLSRRHSWIDSTRMALQGQSWGGYQTAQLITMTTKYKAAMAGAPVSNMFSAYGGIRWGSGYARTFQYERGQSRIGATIWERPDLYIENSPIFGIPKVTTPLLIMHNDKDGAVPWYQGIEMYIGLRRLSKPVWMLNYNGDGHNLTQLANKKDLSIRMRQFFDYYLLDAPMPYWMEYGVPASEKGTNYGLELINE